MISVTHSGGWSVEVPTRQKRHLQARTHKYTPEEEERRVALTQMTGPASQHEWSLHCRTDQCEYQQGQISGKLKPHELLTVIENLLKLPEYCTALKETWFHWTRLRMSYLFLTSCKTNISYWTSWTQKRLLIIKWTKAWIKKWSWQQISEYNNPLFKQCYTGGEGVAVCRETQDI